MKATSRDAIKNIVSVSPDVLPMFKDSAKELIALQDGDAEKALQMALAFMSGSGSQTMINRSLLSGQEHFVTF
jgi:hypothetical protein